MLWENYDYLKRSEPKWLFLMTLQAIHLIISTTLQIVKAILFSSGINIKLSNIKIPRDIHTAYTHHFTEPDIIPTACCPTCFSLYSSPIPYKCQWKESPRSRPCNTDLWKRKNTPKGPKMVPWHLYTTQSFDSWIHFFLSRPIIIDSLKETAWQCMNNPPAFGAEMRDIQDSPAWCDVTGHLFNPHRLVFGLYVNWFNPYINKVAGKPIISISHKFGWPFWRQKHILQCCRPLLPKPPSTPTVSSQEYLHCRYHASSTPSIYDNYFSSYRACRRFVPQIWWRNWPTRPHSPTCWWDLGTHQNRSPHCWFRGGPQGQWLFDNKCHVLLLFLPLHLCTNGRHRSVSVETTWRHWSVHSSR